MKKFLESLLDWVYKKKCYFCRSSKEAVRMCSKCYDDMDFLPVQVNRIVEGKKVYCAGVYSKNLQKLIRGLKYHNQKDLAFYLAKFMAEYLEKITDKNDLRSKQIILNEVAKKEFLRTKEKIIELSKIINKDITYEELEIFRRVIDKMENNINKYNK